MLATFLVLLVALAIFRLAGGDGTPAADASGAPPPRRVAIPAIGVSAPVVPLGLDRNGELAAPTDYNETGWYAAGPEPGENGPAVIAGHVDSESGPAVFFKLPKLRRGDLIRVGRADGSKVSFTVDRIEQWPKAQFPTHRVYGRTRTPALRLVTCSGPFDSATGHYTDNTIVYASLR
jgi:LPXTG-site transpeptidase (sortase) family protein